MKLNDSWKLRLAQILLGTAVVAALVFVGGTNAHNGPIHSATDWSHRHLVFSTPNSLAGRIQLSSNPRYVQQLVRRNAEKGFSASALRWRRAQPDPLKRDWSMNMGTNAKVGAGVYPAKYSFDVTTANCGTAPQPDFVVYNTGLAGSNTAATAAASGTFSGATGVLTIFNPTLGTTLTLSPGASNANTGVGTGTYGTGTNAVEAANVIAAMNIAGNGSFVGIIGFSNAGAAATFHASASGVAANLIQVSSTGTFTWTTGATFSGGATGQADIMAFDNLYSGCTAPTPNPYWAYNTGGTVITSPAISFDGTQVAFIETQAASASLVVLKWSASATDNFNNPTNPTSVAPNLYQACTAPCMTVIPFSLTGNPRFDTNSSPFYDFPTDTLYVGDTGGRLRQFTNVFLGTPAETTANGWPVTLTANVITTSAVYDSVTKQVFIGDAGGFLYSVLVRTPPLAPVLTKSARVGFSVGVVESPIVDSVAGTVYVYVSNNSATAPATGNQSAVFQFHTNFAAGTSGTTVTVGDSSAAIRAFAGDFDNAYYSSASGNAGHLYVCGSQTGANNYIPTLWQVPITGAGAMGVPVEGPALATAINNTCSPVVEVFNSGTAKDLIFVSVQNRGNNAAPVNCPANVGCLMSFDVTSGAAISPAGTTTAAKLQVTGGASGVIIDNTVGAGTLAGASQVYFTPLNNQACTTSGGNGGCAIQASQSGLL